MPKKTLKNNIENNEKMPGGITGKGFMPGKSGNPNGRPKKGTAIADILNDIGLERIIVNGEEITKREAVMRKVYAEAAKGQSWAIHFIADRTEGKAVERIEQEIKRDEIVIK